MRIPGFGLSNGDAADEAAGAGAGNMSIEDEEKVEALREELDGLVASACVLCDGAQAMISRPFVSEKEKLRDEWAL